MCGEGRLWQGPCFLALFDMMYSSSLKVRVVQHKQTRELYALKYINKSKCVKMKAVPNIIQERRLLEEVRYFLSCPLDLIQSRLL
jgi:1,4-dihydroxy-2-naphthoyl-CoA synthase